MYSWRLNNSVSSLCISDHWNKRLCREKKLKGWKFNSATACACCLWNVFLEGNLAFHLSIVGSVVECSPATRAARVRFPDDAKYFLYGTHCIFVLFMWSKLLKFANFSIVDIKSLDTDTTQTPDGVSNILRMAIDCFKN